LSLNRWRWRPCARMASLVRQTAEAVGDKRLRRPDAMHFKVVRETSGQLYASSPLQVEPLAQPQSRHEDHPRHRSRTSLATTASTMAASEGVTPASRFARTPSRTKLSRTGSARRPRGPGSTHSPSRACEWPCLRGLCWPPIQARAISQTAFEAWGGLDHLAPRARTREGRKPRGFAPLSRETAGTISSHIHHSRCKSCSHFQARLLAASFSSP
jgi:hypothetical protein